MSSSNGRRPSTSTLRVAKTFIGVALATAACTFIAPFDREIPPDQSRDASTDLLWIPINYLNVSVSDQCATNGKTTPCESGLSGSSTYTVSGANLAFVARAHATAGTFGYARRVFTAPGRPLGARVRGMALQFEARTVPTLAPNDLETPFGCLADWSDNTHYDRMYTTIGRDSLLRARYERTSPAAPPATGWEIVGERGTPAPMTLDFEIDSRPEHRLVKAEITREKPVLSASWASLPPSTSALLPFVPTTIRLFCGVTVEENNFDAYAIVRGSLAGVEFGYDPLDPPTK